MPKTVLSFKLSYGGQMPALQVQNIIYRRRITSGIINSRKNAKENRHIFPDNPQTLRDFRELKAGKRNKLNF